MVVPIDKVLATDVTLTIGALFVSVKTAVLVVVAGTRVSPLAVAVVDADVVGAET